MNAAFQAKVRLCQIAFQAAVSYENGGLIFSAGWKKEKDHVLDLQELVKEIGVEIPDFLKFRLEMEAVAILFDAKKEILMLQMAANNQWGIQFGADLKRKYYFCFLKPGLKLKLNELPLLGKYMDSASYIRLAYVQLTYGAGKSEQINYLLESRLSGKELSFGSKAEEPPKTLEVMRTALTEEDKQEKEEDHWTTVNKQIGPSYIRRVRASFEDGKIVVMLDASITISILTLDFLELQVGIDIAESFKPSFGLSGLCASVSKPPLFLSGGLYYEKKQNRYTGQLIIKYQKFTFLGMGSYQPENEQNKEAFFAYLFLGYPFGGPPCFYITGLAAGFGVNQRLSIPDIGHVPDFPFIRAAADPDKKTDAGTMLASLGEYIIPSNGNDFLTAGVRFTSFGMVESIVLLNVEFGQKFEVSLLGLSAMDLPPKAEHPIVHGSLALKAVFCPDDGFLQIEGALTKDAYLFASDCHITGGFAFYSWFSGEHAGDFVLTVGGYHPSFQKKEYYPSVDRVGINWKITDNLCLTGEAYFALVPSCLMAGGKLNLDYHIGKLNAWCHIAADFLIQWNPFYYDISASASIGASYRIDVLFIHHTFSLELAASMHLWGPEFAGEIRIKWYIISFTIKFNVNGQRRPDPICWNEFKDRFLEDKEGDIKAGHSQGEVPVKAGITNGKLKEENGRYYVDAANGEIRIDSQFPCEEIIFNEEDERTRKQETNNCQVGIVPMEMTQLKVQLKLNLKKEDSDGSWKYAAGKGEVVHLNVPSALWDTKNPDMNRGMLQNINMGYCLKAGVMNGPALPENEEMFYSLQTLLENEKYCSLKHPCWHKVCSISVKEEKEEADYQKMADNKVRDSWLEQLSGEYGVRLPEKVETTHFTEHVEELLFAPFLYQQTGARIEEA